ncbi:hypothetical protein [Halalkalibacter sp. APA_J-10(15)]|uniref:hypothetical protein n=1 Tax=Halalkalibacter sp. APA_J-10(15) TaxID=2933805 RepID=UPI001FF12CB4|nr:hypothetical protein [Halalkalibacter sp. APA_J-10(15)]MCK0471392.1 hypothetical protein [Halalkalibacter sp. APA_J-10(15)]
MEKTIEIDGKNIRFKSTAATPLRYKAQFHNDFFTDIMKMEKLTKIKSKNPTYDQLKALDTEVFYNICWVLAKTADKKIPEPLDWLDDFDEFPLFELLPQLQELIISTLQTKKK